VRSVLLSKTSGYYPRRRVTYDYDLVVIGSGPAGERGAVTAANLGKRVLVIEKAVDPGGAAVHTGTLPSKTLRETALFLSGRDQREVYGVGVTIDDSLFVPKLLSRKATVKRLEVDRIRRAFKDSGVEVIRGVGHLVGPHQVHIEVAGKSPSDALTREITSHFILVATGSVPHRPGELPWSDHAVEDSDSILELDVMPGSLIVLGAGVIGCEYAAMFAALGVKVTLVDKRNELLPFLDRDMSEALRVSFLSMGIDVRLEDEQTGVRREKDHIVVELKRGGTLRCDKLLFCGGRSGATTGLGLETAGVKMGIRGSIQVDDQYRSNVPSILAAGDVIGFPALASTSHEEELRPRRERPPPRPARDLQVRGQRRHHPDLRDRGDRSSSSARAPSAAATPAPSRALDELRQREQLARARRHARERRLAAHRDPREAARARGRARVALAGRGHPPDRDRACATRTRRGRRSSSPWTRTSASARTRSAW
jgi:pyruvate/2-oxoglutarate dehydrogenase complex dihydrolipoamide dehydrogenase (E3) component